MNYLSKNRFENARKHSQKNQSRKIFFLTVIFLAGAVIFSFLDSVIISAVSPLWKAENAVSRTLSKTGGFFSSRNILIEENAVLKEKVSSLEIELASLSVSRSQESSILELLGRTEIGTGIVASILTYPPQSPYDVLIVDAGSRDRVILESRVYLPEGPEIGVVSEVFPTTARVRLFSTSGERTNAVLERHSVPVELLGAGAGNFRIVLPRDTEIETGDRILSARVTPSLLAIVEDIKVEATDSFKEVLAASPANIFNVRLVIIRP